MVFKANTSTAQDARIKRFARAVREGERLERERARQHDAHMKVYIAHLFAIIRADALREGGV